MNDKPATVRPGRKRSEDSRLAILTTAFELTAELGYSGLTIEGIAARSGVGKQTIYRWWPSKADVLLDALAVKADLYVPVEDHGSYADDLRAFLLASFTLGRNDAVGAALRALMAHAQVDAEFGKRWRTEFLQRRRDALGLIIERARERDELRRELSPDTIADIVFGVVWYRLLATARPIDERLVAELVTTLT